MFSGFDFQFHLGKVRNGVLEYLKSEACFWQIFSFAEEFFFFHLPIMKVGKMVIAFGMGHQSEDAAGRVADAGDVFHGAIGVDRVDAVGKVAFDVAISEGDLVVLFEDFEGLGFAVEVAFAVGDGDGHAVDVFEPDAFLALGFDIDPAAFVAGLFVVHERRLSFAVFFVDRGDEAEVGDHLEAVADADDEFVVAGEVEDLVADVVVDFVGHGVAGAGVVAVGEAAREG